MWLSDCQLTHPWPSHANIRGLQHHVKDSWLLTVVKSKGIFMPTSRFRQWSRGPLPPRRQYSQGLFQAQACSRWAGAQVSAYIHAIEDICFFLTFSSTSRSLPPSQCDVQDNSRSGSKMLPELTAVTHIPPSPSVLGTNPTLES